MTVNNLDNKKVILLGLVLDATFSFSAVYTQIYYMLERLVISLQERSDNMADTEVRYGVTLLRDHPESLLMERDEYFTANGRETLRRLADVDFYGGSDEGSEELGQAIRVQQRLMTEYEACHDEECRKVLMLFTDSMPLDGNLFPDYAAPEISDIEHNYSYGVTSAYFYTYNGEYIPKMRLSDSSGIVMESSNGTCVFGSIAEMLDWNEKETISNMEILADEILTSNR